MLPTYMSNCGVSKPRKLMVFGLIALLVKKRVAMMSQTFMSNCGVSSPRKVVFFHLITLLAYERVALMSSQGSFWLNRPPGEKEGRPDVTEVYVRLWSF